MVVCGNCCKEVRNIGNFECIVNIIFRGALYINNNIKCALHGIRYPLILFLLSRCKALHSWHDKAYELIITDIWYIISLVLIYQNNNYFIRIFLCYDYVYNVWSWHSFSISVIPSLFIYYNRNLVAHIYIYIYIYIYMCVCVCVCVCVLQ